MFEFNHIVAGYNNIFYKLADTLSGSIFLIVGLYSYNVGLHLIAGILFAVSLTSMVHIFIPGRLIRLIDYALAVTLVLVCLMLVIKSGFYYPYAILAALTCGTSLAIYAYYQKQRKHAKYNSYYYFWHVGAFLTCLFSIAAFTQSL